MPILYPPRLDVVVQTVDIDASLASGGSKAYKFVKFIGLLQQTNAVFALGCRMLKGMAIGEAMQLRKRVIPQ
jgi:hypothetical protein